MDEYQLWIQSLKKGDDVVVTNRHNTSIQKVERTTKTLVIVEKCGRFKKSSGYLVGRQLCDFTQIVQPTEEIRKVIWRSELIYRLKYFKFEEYETDVLEDVYIILNNHKRQ